MYLILCDSTFLNNSSGINTFVRHLYSNRSKEHAVRIITDDVFINKNEYSECNMDYIDIEFMSMDEINYIDKYSQAMSKYIIKNYNHNEQIIFVANSLATTKVLDNISSEFINSKFITYTHIGDLLHDDILNYDFPEKDKKEYIKIVNENDKIFFGTQSENLKNYINTLTPNKVMTLLEPILGIEKTVLDLQFDNILIICSNYKRKRLDQMLSIAGAVGKPTKIILGKIDGYYDIVELAKKHKVKIQILQNIPNKEIMFHVKNSRVLLHISETEFFPYSILESAFHIPCVINSDTNWGKLFPDDMCLKINNRNLNEYVETIKLLYTNNYELKSNYYSYMIECNEQWDNLSKRS